MHPTNKTLHIQDWGMIDYETAFKKQEALQQTIIRHKTAHQHQNNLTTAANYLVFCEHPHVYTLGRTGTKGHLLASDALLKEKQATFFATNRGGEMTYHGPGQLVLYPILDLENFFTDISRYLRLLEEAVIKTLQDFGLLGGRISGSTGVWMDHNNLTDARKVCAIGIRISKWVTMHGLALNVYPDMQYFEQIIPCGMPNAKVTSMAIELGYIPPMQPVKQSLQMHMQHLLMDTGSE